MAMGQSYLQIRDAYQFLGLEIGTPFAETKSKYRRLIKHWHPDISTEPSETAEVKTRSLNEAFERLSSLSEAEVASVRRYFAQKRPVGRRRATPSGPRRRRRVKARRGRDLMSDLQGTRSGNHWRLRIATCRGCGGWGASWDAGFEVCPDCAGLGRYRQDGQWDFDARCPSCQGHGCLFDKPCGSCDGRGDGGFYAASCFVPGTAPGSVVLRRVTGQGHRGLAGAASGDLYLRILTTVTSPSHNV
jgi:molecular chaperone DnaJ